MKLLPLGDLRPGEVVSHVPVLVTAAVDHVDADGAVFVRLAEAGSQPQRAAVGVPFGMPTPQLEVDATVLVLVTPGDPVSLVVVARVHDRLTEVPARLELRAEHELSLRCGDASIELLSNGDIRIRGGYVESEAEGIHRIRGAQVRIN